MESSNYENMGYEPNGDTERVMPSTSYNINPDLPKKEECLTKTQKLVLLVVFVVVVMGGLMGAIIYGVNMPTEPYNLVSDADARVQPELPWVSSTGSYRYATVAADAQVCSQIGTEIMASNGGSAVDAAIAAMLCVGVANPHSAGVGGGFFMTIYDTPRGGDQMEKWTVIARETAPAFATQDMYVNDTTKARVGGQAIAIPGEVRGYYEAWKRYGKAQWKELFEPSIRLAREGIPVSKVLHDKIQSYLQTDDYPHLKDAFSKEDGSLVVEGDLLKRPQFADTLERIANDPYTFYNGSLAEDIVKDISEQGGNMTIEDLADYGVRTEEPLQVKLENGNFTLLFPPPPSSGVVLGHILKVLDGYKFDSTSDSTVEKAVLFYHRIVESFKFAYARRSELGDEEFLNITELLEKMKSKDFSDNIRSQITDDKTQPIEYYAPAFDSSADSRTSHLSVLAPNGGAASITSTINLIFGSKVVGNRTGIIFNNEMDDFSTPGMKNAFGLPASPANYIKSGKRPLSSMSPVIVLDSNDRVQFVSGASGGPRITSSTAMACIFALWLDKDIQDIADTPRLHHQLSPNKIYYQTGFNLDILDGLESKGHEVEERNLAVVQNILNTCDHANKCTPENLVKCLQEKCILSSSDGGKGGSPDGY